MSPKNDNERGDSHKRLAQLASVGADDTLFKDYLDNTRADKDPNGCWLETSYSSGVAASHRADATGTGHDEVGEKSPQALRLRFWRVVVKKMG